MDAWMADASVAGVYRHPKRSCYQSHPKSDIQNPGLGSDGRMEEGEISMQLNVPPDIGHWCESAWLPGAFADAEDVIRRALEAQNAEESWTEEERRALSTHVEEGF